MFEGTALTDDVSTCPEYVLSSVIRETVEAIDDVSGSREGSDELARGSPYIDDAADPPASEESTGEADEALGEASVDRMSSGPAVTASELTATFLPLPPLPLFRHPLCVLLRRTSADESYSSARVPSSTTIGNKST